MSEINLYNLLKRIPGATNEEVQKAVAYATNSTDVATKADIKDVEIKTYIAEVKTELIEKIDEMKNTMIVWFIGVSFANAAIMITLLKFFSS